MLGLSKCMIVVAWLEPPNLYIANSTANLKLEPIIREMQSIAIKTLADDVTISHQTELEEEDCTAIH